MIINEILQVVGMVLIAKGVSLKSKSLHWHLQYLKDNPNAAKELLEALLPEKDSQLG